MPDPIVRHTPGPWLYDDDTATVDTELGVAVAGINVELPNYEANARLIAAAPSLLEACQAAYDELLAWHKQIGPLTPAGYEPRTGPTLHRLRNAIVDATNGGQP